MTARGAHVNGPFTLTPKGGLDNGQVFIDADGVYHNSNTFSGNDRPQIVFNGDGNWFRGKHEVRFGASVRHYTDDQTTRYAGDFLDIQLDPDGTTLAIPIRPYHQVNRAMYTSLYVGDTLSLDRLTLNGSVRFDRATSSVDAITVAAHPIVPDVLPGVSAPAIKNAVVWNTLSPRAGLAYAIGAGPQDHRARQLLGVRQPARSRRPPATSRRRASPTPTTWPSTPTTTSTSSRASCGSLLFAKNIIPSNPSKAVNQIASGLQRAADARSRRSGVDRELFPNFGVSASYTWRTLREPAVEPGAADRRDVGRLRRGRPPDRRRCRTARRTTCRTTRCARAPRPRGPARSPRTAKGYHRTLQRDRDRRDQAAEATAGWAASASRGTRRASTSTIRRRRSSIRRRSPPIRASTAACVTVPTAGSGKSQIYLTLPSYQFTANGFYQGPWGVNFGGNFLVRQGYTQMFYAQRGRRPTIRSTRPRTSWSTAGNIGKYRLPAVKSLDARIEKMFTFRRHAGRVRRRRLQRAQQRHRAGPGLRRRLDQVQPGRRDHEPAHRALRAAGAVLAAEVTHG